MFRKQKSLLLLLTIAITGFNLWMLMKDAVVNKRNYGTTVTASYSDPEQVVDLSIVAACMDRNDDISKSVKSWLKALNRVNISAEIIIVDWSSKISIQDTLVRNKIMDPRIVHVHVVGQSKWILSIAYNTGFQLSSSKKSLLKLDCDTFTEGNFFKVHNITMNSFYAGNYRLAETENEMHLNGVAMFPRVGFFEIGGYDERIQTYGFDDDNLYERLVDKGYIRKDFHKGYLKHIPHNDTQRVINQPDSQEDVDMENYMNHAALSMLPKWTNENQKSSFTSEKVNANQHLVLIDFIPPSLKEIVKKGNIDHIKLQYCIRKLKSKGIPGSMLTKYGDLNYYKKLLKTYSTGPMIMIEVQHGLGNRLRSLASAAVISAKTKRHLRVIWKSDNHCSADFYDLFDKNQTFDVYNSIDKKELSNKNIQIYNYMEPEVGAKKYVNIEHNTDKHIYVKSAYILSSKLVQESQISEFLRNLVPSAPVRKIIDSFPDMSRCIGVHIRNKSPKNEIKLNKNEYPTDGWNDLMKYRKAAKAEVFISEMEAIMTKDPDTCFFVSGDNEASKTSIQKAFETSHVWVLEGSCDDRTVNCLHKALAELYILGRTKRILGSFWSSYSEVAGLLVGKRPIYAGKDFY